MAGLDGREEGESEGNDAHFFPVYAVSRDDEKNCVDVMRRSSLGKVGKNRIFPIFLFSSGTYFLGNAFRIRLTTYKNKDP